MSPLKRVARPPLGAVAGRAFLIFICTAVAAVAIIWGVHGAQIAKVRERLASSESRFVKTLGNALSRELVLVGSDLEYLSGSQVVASLLDVPNARNRHALEVAFQRFADSKRIYDQIRYLDETGMEIVRVNWTPDGGAVAVPLSKLQDKGDRYYFRESANLLRGEIYVSPLDLNVEGTRVEEPYKPMIRLATPVFDGEEHRKGIVVLNYLAKRLTTGLSDLASGADGDVMLLNSEGFFLVAPYPGLEWGFMFPDGKDRTLEKLAPSAWEAIRSRPFGTVKGEEGWFFFSRVHPEIDPNVGGGAVWAKEIFPFWTVVSRVTPDRLGQLYAPVARTSLMLGVVSLMILAVASWVIAEVTLRRNLFERAMRERELLYKTLARHFPNGVILLLDRCMKCVLAEGQGLSRLGVNRDEIEGVEITTAFPGAAGSGIETGLRDALSGTEVNFEVPVNGCVYHVYVVPVKGMNGEIFAEMLMTQDITERKQMEEQLRQAATVDGLTGLLNRRRFTEAAENMVRHARRYGTPLCLCMCDIDHFKYINDTHGHQAGDNVLQGYGALLRQSVRETDFVGRYGGDEFCILLPGTPLEEAVGVIERVRHLLEEQAFENDRGDPIHVTGSFGVASFGPKIDGVGTFFEAADAALYESKRGGRNRVTAASR